MRRTALVLIRISTPLHAGALNESRSLMGIKDLGEFKLDVVERFKGTIFAAVKTAEKLIPRFQPGREAKVIEAWNVSAP